MSHLAGPSYLDIWSSITLDVSVRVFCCCCFVLFFPRLTALLLWGRGQMAQELLVGWVRFLGTTTGFWLRRTLLALQRAAVRKSGRYLFRIMCQMLVRVARAFLLMLVRT